jgi:hypothetical protein
MSMLLRRLLAKLLALLQPAQTLPARDARHVAISSYSRRYPGRTPEAELRRNLGWIAATADRSHRDRRA